MLLDPEHPDAHPNSDAAPEKTGLSRVLVFSSVVEGGFGNVLKLEEGATLELGRFERHHASPLATHPEEGEASASASTPAVDSNATTSSTAAAAMPATDRKSRRFTNFPFRKRQHNHNPSVAGPALAVVDAEPSTPAPAPDGTKGKDAGADEGVKVTIRLVAMNSEGTPLSSPNEQATYLHVVRMGALPVEGEEDTRQWVVKVVKREATIGVHTFHLHEIYGLSAQSSAPSHPVAPIASLPSSPPGEDDPAHTYPPTTPTMATAPAVVREDEPSSECLLCLSSPREVVLLPCRHLVACKDCAINMVEFGAGGTIVQPAETEPAPAAGDGTTPATEGEGGAAADNAIPTAANTGAGGAGGAARRKRKAKGWFCPVCRQRMHPLLSNLCGQPN